jgi:hypothetical protein
LRAEWNGLGQITVSERTQNKQIRKKAKKIKLFNLKCRKLSMGLQTELPTEAHPAKGQRLEEQLNVKMLCSQREHNSSNNNSIIVY